MTENYKLTTANIPGRRTHSVYADILREFRESGEESVLIEVEDKKTPTLRAGLRAAIKHEGTDDVRLVQRVEETYLVRLSAPVGVSA